LTTTRTATKTTRLVRVGDTTIAVTERGHGRPVLLIHGGGENAEMMSAQADSIAAAGYRAITYDRRGTGDSGRDSWPGDGADQHADDAAALLGALGAERAVVLGLSTGGVIAINLTARHPELVSRAIAWEPPALGILPDGEQINDAMMAPALAHLADHPGDFVGAQAILLSAILGFPVDVDDPDFAAARANAEPMIVDEPAIPLKRFDSGDLAGKPVTIAVGSSSLDLISAAAQQLSHWIGTPVVEVQGEHEVYFSEPATLTAVLRTLAPTPHRDCG